VTLRVFVMLPRHLDTQQWRQSFLKGAVPDQTPYGYHFAEELDAELTFSAPTATPNGVVGLVDRAFKRVLGFDIRHVWHNRADVLSNKHDVIWTHTEYEHLGIAALRWLMGKQGAPVIAQSVWLVDAWPKFWTPKQWLYRRLLQKAAVATFHSSKNEAIAKDTFTGTPTEVVQFGISLDSYPLQAPRRRCEPGRPVRVLALGNDRHRDWTTLFEALGGHPEFELRVGSGTWPKSFSAANTHATVMKQAEVRAAYAWADCVVVPLKSNLHASGITAILESVATGVPVIATLTGGLDEYIDDTGVHYVPLGDTDALRQSVRALATNAPAALKRAIQAQKQLVERSLTSRGFAHRHVALSNRILQSTQPTLSNQ